MPGKSVVFFASHAHGGVREIWTNLAEGFHELGYSARLVGLYPLPAITEPPTNILAWTYVIPGTPTGLSGKFRMLRELARWMITEKPQVIISSMPAANVLVPFFARIFSPATRVIISHHSPANVYKPGLNLLDRFTGRGKNVAAVVSVSNSVNRTLNGKPAAYKAKRVTINNAIPPRIEDLLERLRLQAINRPETRKIVVSGRLEWPKNHPMLIRATALMRDVEVDVLGCGADEDELRAMIDDLGLTDRMHLLGNRDREEALTFLSRGDVFVQVSLFEGHSLALIEAAKLGLPLVVSNVPSQVEAITAKDGTRCGIAVDLEDDAGLARAVESILDDPQQRALWSDRALKLARECTFEQMMKQYVALARPLITPAERSISAAIEPAG
ncbi:MAG: glycosyltransferase family 4 protein [Sphingobium sp.]|uniref:glycosyltransferase family 4 protein n=1 Tax=Sphingobium sp. TaxID=1912891 RepID=UPI0029A3DFA8|nr:glycosyltransferase family 4 protein [Sphingobium sp.]MDX3911751.1 glycosyltransferase family 4 protein [Sphingobium sp.]